MCAMLCTRRILGDSLIDNSAKFELSADSSRSCCATGARPEAHRQPRSAHRLFWRVAFGLTLVICILRMRTGQGRAKVDQPETLVKLPESNRWPQVACA